MKKHLLKVTKREVFGKKLKQLRKTGVLPANIYGKDVKSTAVELPLKEFEAVYKETGETGLIDLELGSEKRPVLIHNVQLDYMTQLPVHADFYQVNLKEKVKTMVPVELTGEPKAVIEKLGLLLQTLNEMEVEALPSDLPEKIEIDVTNLAAVNDQILVSDVKIPTGVEILTDQAQVIAKISELISKEAEAELEAEAAAAEAAKAETSEAATGEATAATEAAKEGTSETSKEKEESPKK